jgi:starvation-inducible DNA-binding protein
MRFASIVLAATMLAGPTAGMLAGSAAAQSAGGAAAQPNQAPSARSISPDSTIKMFQPLGSFPTNTVTNRPFVGPQQGSEGYKATVASLQRTLTELQQLQLQLKQSHWNVSGTMFYPLHLLFQQHYDGISKDADMVAQRLLAIGASSDGRATTIVQTSKIPEIPGGFLDDAQLIVWWTNTYKVVGDEIRQAIRDTSEPDPTSSNLLQSVEQQIDEYQWFFRAMVQGTPTDKNTGWNLNDNKPLDLPDQVPAGQPHSTPQTGQAVPAR